MEISDSSFNRIEEPFQIGHTRVKEAVSMPAQHYHDAYEIYYMVQGERNYFIKNRIYTVDKGTLVFINTDELHMTTISTAPAHERILINFKQAYISSLLPGFSLNLLECFTHSTNAIKLDKNEQVYVENLFIRMINEDKKRIFGYEDSIKIMLIELLMLISRYIYHNPNDKFKNQNPLHKKVLDIVSYINANFSEPVTLSTLSKTFFLSKCYLSRIFKEVTGFNFTEYVNNVRILESKKLLKESCLNITRIAENVGYDNATHFGRIFKSIEGISPSKYRKNLLVK